MYSCVMRINISISKSDLQQIDDYCERTGRTRSKFLVRSATIAILEMESGIESKKEVVAKSDTTCKHGYPVNMCKKCK